MDFEIIVGKIKEKANLTDEEINKKILEKQQELSNLVSKEGAAYIIAKELEAKGIRVSKEHPGFQGSNPNNICNRGTTKKGVQLEISRDLRDDLEKVQLISEAVQAALVRCPG